MIFAAGPSGPAVVLCINISGIFVNNHNAEKEDKFGPYMVTGASLLLDRELTSPMYFFTIEISQRDNC